ncbi:hypothetical protein E2553_39590 [Paraburkholderia dipogonis]|uniref:Uncharacterized protein n=1 Tax=Paraburkholderia dipogonis TaxID=1211383 RepID=A0A4Y8MJ96_9BURK|nr:hypothetical protein [Paraburkholderia dipogonis]TFE37536.1 hypothetical protein E2553_39590 [Paraburkholderia dipogonis]
MPHSCLLLLGIVEQIATDEQSSFGHVLNQTLNDVKLEHPNEAIGGIRFRSDRSASAPMEHTTSRCCDVAEIVGMPSDEVPDAGTPLHLATAGTELREAFGEEFGPLITASRICIADNSHRGLVFA